MVGSKSIQPSIYKLQPLILFPDTSRSACRTKGSKGPVDESHTPELYENLCSKHGEVIKSSGTRIAPADIEEDIKNAWLA